MDALAAMPSSSSSGAPTGVAAGKHAPPQEHEGPGREGAMSVEPSFQAYLGDVAEAADGAADGGDEDGEDAAPLAGPGAPFWPTRREEDDPQVQVTMRAKYRRTVNTQTTTHELVRVEALEDRLALMEEELAGARQALTDTRVQLEVEHRRCLEGEIEMARQTAVERNRFLQEKYEVKVEQLRLSERSKVSNLESQLRREAEDAVREAVADADARHRAELGKVQEELSAERQARLKAAQELERLSKKKEESAEGDRGAAGAASAAGAGDAASGDDRDGARVRKVGLGDIVKIEFDQKVQMERAERERLELRSQIDKMGTDMKHARGEIDFKAKRIAELEQQVSSEMASMLKEREEFESAQRALREDMSSKMARLNVELRAARRHLDDVRGDYRRERHVNEIISSRQLEVLGQLKRHNLELSERIMKLERRLSAARQLAETRGITGEDQRGMAAAEAAGKFGKTDREDEEWSRLASRRQQSNEETVVTRSAAEAAILESGRRNAAGAAGDGEALPRLPRTGFGDEAMARVQRAKRDLVPGSANILKVKDACQSMQTITGIISDYQRYLDEMLRSSIAEQGAAAAPRPEPPAAKATRAAARAADGGPAARGQRALSSTAPADAADARPQDPAAPEEPKPEGSSSSGKLSLPPRQSRPSARRRHPRADHQLGRA